MSKEYLVEEKFPLFWCQGCGSGIVLGSIVRAMDKLKLDKTNTVIVTGIGCWGKADDYIDANSLHGTHGRALSFATGVKLANPKLKVIVLMGDGDATTIGGNHLIHTARRNVDVTAIIVNNLNYGMTGGQYSGTTPKSAFTKTSPYGHVEDAFDVCGLVVACGAPYVARGTVVDVIQLDKLIYDALCKTGFSMVEAIAQCPTHFGKANKMPKTVAMMKNIKENTVPIAKAKDMSKQELKDKFVTGKFVDDEKEDYSALYEKIIDACKEGK